MFGFSDSMEKYVGRSGLATRLADLQGVRELHLRIGPKYKVSVAVGRAYYILNTCLDNIPGVRKIVVGHSKFPCSLDEKIIELAMMDMDEILGIKRIAWSDAGVNPESFLDSVERERMNLHRESRWETKAGSSLKWNWKALFGDSLTTASSSINDGSEDESSDEDDGI